MSEPLTAEAMRAVEAAAIASGAVTGLELMERAGRGVVEALFERWPDLDGHPGRAVILCGPGNNGGDGFVIARLLAARGWTIEVLFYGDPARLPPDAATNRDRWISTGAVATLPFPESGAEGAARLAAALDGSPPAGLVVDALFGTGLARPLSGLRPVFAVLAGRRAAPGAVRVVAVDLPSGLSSDDGTVVGGDPALALPADLTVSFHALKRGHCRKDGPALCGRTVVKNIGLARWDGAESGDGE